MPTRVGEYLGGEAMTGTDFDFDTIGRVVSPFLREAAIACRDLQSVLREAQADVEFAADCNFSRGPRPSSETTGSANPYSAALRMPSTLARYCSKAWRPILVSL